MKDTVSKKTLIASLAVAVAATTLGTWGITYAATKGEPTSALNVSEKGNHATSGKVWFTLGESPEGWEQLTKDPLNVDPAAYGSEQKAVASKDSLCTYSVTLEHLPLSEFSGVSSDYLAMKHLLSYGENRGASNPELAIKDVETSAGKVPFHTASYGINEDVNGDGEKDKTKNYYLVHVLGEFATEKEGAPMVQISYTCNDEGKWSEDTLNSMLAATTINLTGDPAPAVEKVENENSLNEEAMTEMEEAENAKDAVEMKKSEEELKKAKEEKAKMIEELQKGEK